MRVLRRADECSEISLGNFEFLRPISSHREVARRLRLSGARDFGLGLQFLNPRRRKAVSYVCDCGGENDHGDQWDERLKGAKGEKPTKSNRGSEGGDCDQCNGFPAPFSCDVGEL